MTRIARWIARFAVMLVLGVPGSGLASPFSALYVLGDSLSDQGNLFMATQSVAGPANALPASDHYFNGRFSNGPVYTDRLAQLLGIPLVPSLVGGNNFAYGGARTSYNTVEQSVGGPLPTGLFPWSLNAEVQAFNARGIHDPDALYIVFSGANDIGDIVARGLNPATVIPTVVDGVVSAVQAFAAAGAQNIIVANVPNLGLTPAFSALGPPAVNPATLLSQQFNTALHAALGAFAALDIIEFQTDDLFDDVASNPALYGLTNVTAACYSGFVAPNPAGTECSTPNQYLFWDQVHPTAAAHSILAGAIVDVAVVSEPSAPLLLAAMLLAFLACRKGYKPRSQGTPLA